MYDKSSRLRQNNYKQQNIENLKLRINVIEQAIDFINSEYIQRESAINQKSDSLFCCLYKTSLFLTASYSAVSFVIDPYSEESGTSLLGHLFLLIALPLSSAMVCSVLPFFIIRKYYREAPARDLPQSKYFYSSFLSKFIKNLVNDCLEIFSVDRESKHVFVKCITNQADDTDIEERVILLDYSNDSNRSRLIKDTFFATIVIGGANNLGHLFRSLDFIKRLHVELIELHETSPEYLIANPIKNFSDNLLSDLEYLTKISQPDTQYTSPVLNI